jgi:hypothetical protein
VTAFVELVVVDQVRIRLLRPAPWSGIEFVREDAHSNRDRDTFGTETPFAPILPIETGTRECRVCQPCEGDVVEDTLLELDRLGP